MQPYAMPEKAGFEVRDLESLRERTPPAEVDFLNMIVNASLKPKISNFYPQVEMVEWLRVSSWDIKRVTYVQEQLGLTPLEMHRIGLMAYEIEIIGETARPEPYSSHVRADRFYGFIASSPQPFWMPFVGSDSVEGVHAIQHYKTRGGN